MAEPRSEFERLIERRNHTAFLGELIDVELLVNRSMLRQNGIDPEGVRVYYDPSYIGISAGEDEIVTGPRGLAFMERKPEYGYVVMAHELTHLAQGPRATDSYVAASGRPTRFHARDEREQEAFFWEAQEAARFGWSREEYEAFVAELHTMLDIPERYRKHVEIEQRERAYAALPVMSRRPPEDQRPHASSGISDREVRVRNHRRRV